MNKCLKPPTPDRYFATKKTMGISSHPLGFPIWAIQVFHPKTGVSENRGTPKWMVKIMEPPIKMGWFGGTTIFGNIQTVRLRHPNIMMKPPRKRTLQWYYLSPHEGSGAAGWIWVRAQYNVYICVYIYINICTFIHICVGKYTYLACRNKMKWVYMYVCMYVCIYIICVSVSI